MTNDTPNEMDATSSPSRPGDDGTDGSGNARRRRRGNRGGQRRRKGKAASNGDAGDPRPDDIELPERIAEGRPSAEAGGRATVRKPQIGDTMPAPQSPGASASRVSRDESTASANRAKTTRKRTRDRTTRSTKAQPRQRGAEREADVMSAETAEMRRGRERNGRPIGRYLMCVQVRPGMAQVAVLEGRSLMEHYVSRPADDVSQIHGNIYVGRVQNVLPGMEAAFVDIATPKNAVLYRGDVQFDAEDIEEHSDSRRIEDILRPRQLIICQVTKNPIGAKGARLTQEVSLPGRFVVLIPNSRTFGISKRLPDDTRKRLRAILDRVKPAEHGLIVRTAAEHATEEELRADMQLLLAQWDDIATRAGKIKQPTLLHREPELAVRRIREEFNTDYRGVIIDDRELYQQVRDYVGAFNPELGDRVEYYDPVAEGLSLFERQHVHEQVHKALDRKIWLPSGGSLIIEHTEALTVIDVNTGKNVGRSSLEETVFHNNLEAAQEVAKQVRLRDIGGIIVIDFIDMERKDNRQAVIDAFRAALARDKTRTQVFDITELGLVEMTRKRIGEGLLTEFSDICPECEGRGIKVDTALLD
ncbi:MAG: Rne/Rng family ribonuclease [Acidimicrobiia bacterium]|jgi:ribonuclease E|nr:Rne/Rng family ribonuclease [Acidimicrobiia bacterium]MDQ3389858.1 Rne/Rng family ribonuclease [Actinomycetota bacterium]